MVIASQPPAVPGEMHRWSGWSNSVRATAMVAPPPAELEGTATCWGSNAYGQSAAPAGRFAGISAGGEHTCGLRDNERVECWGDNHYRQSAAPAGARFYAVSAGFAHTYGIKRDSSVSCWGGGGRERGGEGGEQRRAGAGQRGWDFAMVSAGQRHTRAMTVAGEAACGATTRIVGMLPMRWQG